MTSLVRRVAGGLTIVEALWLLYALLYSWTTTGVTPVSCLNSCPPTSNAYYSPLTIALVLPLLALGTLGLWGASFAYAGSAVLSAAGLLSFAYTVAFASGLRYYANATNDGLIGVALALAALATNLYAMRRKGGISEQANPMNLPVFG